MLTHHLPALRRPGAQLLAIGAHADDIEIGAGGTVLQLLSAAPATVDVRWVVLSATPARAEEARASAAAFCSDARSVTVDVHDLPDGRFPAEWGTLKETLQALAAETDPDLVLTTRPGDAHQDHRLLATMMPTAFRDHAIWGYEIPKYDGDTTQPSLYVPLDETIMDRKIALLHEHFPSQADRDWWDDDLFRALPRLRGVESRNRWAEAFVTAKVVVQP
ncbi:MAG: PIG-L family deacetylase [Actinomycetota bacterium]